MLITAYLILILTRRSLGALQEGCVPNPSQAAKHPVGFEFGVFLFLMQCLKQLDQWQPP